MCEICDRKTLGRRGFLAGAGAIAAAAFAAAVPAARAAEGAPTSLSSEDALAQLKEGNARYVKSPRTLRAGYRPAARKRRGASSALGDDHRLR